MGLHQSAGCDKCNCRHARARANLCLSGYLNRNKLDDATQMECSSFESMPPSPRGDISEAVEGNGCPTTLKLMMTIILVITSFKYRIK